MNNYIATILTYYNKDQFELKNVNLFLYINDQFALLNKQEFQEFQEKVSSISSFDFYSDFR